MHHMLVKDVTTLIYVTKILQHDPDSLYIRLDTSFLTSDVFLNVRTTHGRVNKFCERVECHTVATLASAAG